LHGRSAAAADRARQQILNELPNARIEAIGADLSSLAEVRRLAVDVRARFADLSILINNAGIERWERHVTVDGFEETWAVNHLALFLPPRTCRRRAQHHEHRHLHCATGSGPVQQGSCWVLARQHFGHGSRFGSSAPIPARAALA
jgi:NAD(P)-dependent dehydrogenase (short-subunit alcohol dehydrogenase family)